MSNKLNEKSVVKGESGYSMKKKRITLGIGVGILILALGLALFLVSIKKTSGYQMDYIVFPISTRDQVLQIGLTITASGKSFGSDVTLYAGEIPAYDFQCADNDGNEITIYGESGFIIIAAEDANAVNLFYKVNLGAFEKHGHRGIFNDKLLVFDGGNVFMFPSAATAYDDKEIRKTVSKITVLYDVTAELTWVIPFSYTELSGNVITKVDLPAGSEIYELQKSCYAFGDFEEYAYRKETGEFRIYMEKGAAGSDTDLVLRGLNNLYDYYSDVFGYDIPDYSQVILNKASDGVYVAGGNSSHVSGTTFEYAAPRCWQLMGHALFHSFFNVKGIPSDFLLPGVTWFYEGLAAYHENASMDSLSEEIKTALDLNAQEGLSQLYRSYLYFRYKDQDLYLSAADPSVEDSPAKSEFIHYTQAPLVVKGMEDLSEYQFSEPNRIIRYIVNNKSALSGNLDSIINYALGSGADAFKEHYIDGADTLPLWYMTSGGGEDPVRVIDDLNVMEYTLFTWFVRENESYAGDYLTGGWLDVTVQNALDEDVHFAGEEDEENVLIASPTVYALLMEYALRAKVCRVDYQDPFLRIKLLGIQENVDLWNEYIKNIQ